MNDTNLFHFHEKVHSEGNKLNGFEEDTERPVDVRQKLDMGRLEAERQVEEEYVDDDEEEGGGSLTDLTSAQMLTTVRDILHLGSTGTSIGFNIAQSCTELGFSVARGCVSAPASAMDIILGHSNSSISQVLRSVHTTVGAAEAIALTSILMAHTAASFSIAAADRTLDMTGVQRSEEGLVLQGLRATLPAKYFHYTPVLQAIAEMVLTFVAPIKEMSSLEVREALVSFALLQQSSRTPLHIIHPLGRIVLNVDSPRREGSDLLRCMGFAAAAYGSLAMNFLEFIPRGTYRSDVLPLLVPGVTGADVIRRSDEVKMFCTGFLLISDHSRRTIVLAIRGSMHINDVITDLTCKPVKCANIFSSTSRSNYFSSSEGIEHDIGPDAHEGFLLAANELDALLQEDVRKALISRGGTRTDAAAEPYQLLLCGHSLGGGVASVLAVKWENIFSGVRCVALGSPCSFSLRAARATQHLITSVVVCDDLVSRLSLGSAYDLRDACLQLFQTSASTFSEQSVHTDCSTHTNCENIPVAEGQRLSQYIMHIDGLQACQHHPDEFIPAVDMIEHSQYVGSGGLSNERELQAAAKDTHRLEEDKQVALGKMENVLANLRRTCMTSCEKLYPAGKVIHVVGKKEWIHALESSVVEPSSPQTIHMFPNGKEYFSSTGRSVLAISDTDTRVAYLSDQITFSELQLSGSMFSDHMPHHYMHLMRELFPMSI